MAEEDDCIHPKEKLLQYLTASGLDTLMTVRL